MSVADARAEWGEMRERVAAGKSGITIKPTTAKPLTMAELAARYVKDYSKKTKRSWQADENALLKYVVPEFGNVLATEFGLHFPHDTRFDCPGLKW